jgi:hypothetical protein
MNTIIYPTPRDRRKVFDKIHNKLNTSLPQFTAKSSKTKKAIDYIKHYSIVSRMNRGVKENGIHHMTVILTNKSLLETTMWKHRLVGKTKELNMNICTLSSKKDSTFNNVDQIITKLVKAKNANSIPDIIVMCTHGTRTDDIVTLFTQLEFGNLDFTNIGIHQITATVMFDEADKNIGLIAEFVQNLNKELLSKTHNTILRDIHFITATPGRKFWKKLQNAGIKELENIHHYLRDNDIFDYKHEELYSDYRSIDEHHFKNDIDNMTENPIEYANIVLNKIMEQRILTDTHTPLVVFAPAEVKIDSHYEMAKIFRNQNFTVLIINGEQKGFQSPDYSFESIEDFNKRTDTEGELYNTLVKWKSLDENKNKDLAITGYLNVQRGITFCTTGFNFTDMIVSRYHLKDIDGLIQILGRANGEKQYVQIMNIWTPKKVMDDANEMIEILNELHKRDPEMYIESDFRKKTSREVKEPAMTIPDIINVASDEWDNIIKKQGRSYNSELIIQHIRKTNESLANEISKMTKKQITMPKDDIKDKTKTKVSSYKKHILDLVNAANQNQNFSVDITKKEIEKDVYQIFLDEKEKRLIVSRHYGSKLKDTATATATE